MNLLEIFESVQSAKAATKRAPKKASKTGAINSSKTYMDVLAKIGATEKTKDIEEAKRLAIEELAPVMKSQKAVPAFIERIKSAKTWNQVQMMVWNSYLDGAGDKVIR